MSIIYKVNVGRSTDELPDRSYLPGGRTSTPLADIHDTMSHYNSADTSAASGTRGSILDADSWDTRGLPGSPSRALASGLTHPYRSSLRHDNLRSSRNYTSSSDGLDYSPSRMESSHSSPSYSSPYTRYSQYPSTRPGAPSARRPLHFSQKYQSNGH